MTGNSNGRFLHIYSAVFYKDFIDDESFAREIKREDVKLSSRQIDFLYRTALVYSKRTSKVRIMVEAGMSTRGSSSCILRLMKSLSYKYTSDEFYPDITALLENRLYDAFEGDETLFDFCVGRWMWPEVALILKNSDLTAVWDYYSRLSPSRRTILLTCSHNGIARFFQEIEKCRAICRARVIRSGDCEILDSDLPEELWRAILSFMKPIFKE